MNHTYKVVWSRVKGALVVASELAASDRKGANAGSVVDGTRRGSAAIAAAMALAGMALPLGNAAQAQVACVASPCVDDQVYTASESGQITAAFSFNESAVLVADIENVVAQFQTVTLNDTASANLNVAGALNDLSGRITANGDSVVNVNTAGAVAGGTLQLNDTSTLNVNASGGIAGGVQTIGERATLSLNAANAIVGGEQNVLGTLRVGAENALAETHVEVSGGSLVADAAGGIVNTVINVSNGGALTAGVADAFGEGVEVELSADEGTGEGWLFLDADATVAALSGAGRVAAGDGKAAALTVSNDEGKTSSFGGVIEDGEGSVALVKDGEGTQRLEGVNTYTGGTTVLGGTLEGTTDSLTGSIANEATLAFKQDNRGEYASSISGSGQVVIVSEAGTGGVELSGANTHSGGTVVQNALLTIHDDSALGAASGELTLANGRLNVTDDQQNAHTIARDINLDGEGVISITSAADTSVELSGTIAGAGDLHLTNSLESTGEATVRLSGVNDYANTHVYTATTLIGNSDSIKGDVTNHGAVIYDQAVDGVAVGSMSGVGTFEKQGAGNLRLNGFSNVDWTVSAGRLTATAQQFSGNVDIAPSAAFAFDEAWDVSYNGVISGFGNLVKQGAGALTLTADSSAFGGHTVVENGNLIVNTGAGRLGGTLAVNNGGRLKGDGTVGSTILGAGAIVSPGNSIGTLTIDGDLTFDSASVYEVEVDPAGTSSDLIRVLGNANLAGQVAHIGNNGTYAPESVYTILEAFSINGEFDSITSNYAFLDPVLSYEATEVKMELKRNDTPIGDGGDSGNGGSVGEGVDSGGGAGGGSGTGAGEDAGTGSGGGLGGAIGSGNSPIYDAVVVLPTEAVGQALEMLTGEIHASTTSALLNNSRLAREVPLRQLRGHFDAAPVSGVRNDVASWVEVVGQEVTLDGDSNASEAEYSLAGLFIGGHVGVGNGWRLGASFGYTDGEVEVKDKLSKADVETYSASLFGGNSFELGKGQLNVLAGASYSWHDIGTKRSVIFPGVNERLKADYDATTAQVFGEVGYAMPVTNSFIVEPFAGVAVTHHKTDGFSESGGIAALNSASVDNTVTTSTIGLRGKHGFSLGKTAGIVTGSVGWQHAYGDVSPESVFTFAGGGQPFTITGAPIAKDAAVVEVGASVAIGKDASLGLSFSGQYGNGNKDSAGSLNLRVRF